MSKYTSKGERRSSVRIKRKSSGIMPSSTHIQTNMAVAFTSACIKALMKSYTNKEIPKDLVSTVNQQLSRKDNMRPVGRGWTANLHPATVKKLVAQGVFA